MKLKWVGISIKAWNDKYRETWKKMFVAEINVAQLGVATRKPVTA